MARNRTIQYAVDAETGQIWSRVDDQLAVPVLDYRGMHPRDGSEMRYALYKIGIFEALVHEGCLTWTRKIPLKIKNLHRKFWGMKELVSQTEKGGKQNGS